MSTRITLLALFSLSLLFVPGSVEAGPPCVCWPIATGDAPVLADPKGTPDDIVVARTLKILDAKLPVLARMESLRRAALALQAKPHHADRILSRLMARVLDAETGTAQERAKLWFDAGYAVACFRQGDSIDDNLRGYRWIARAIELSGGDGAMHYGAALAVLMPHPNHDQFPRHVKAMKAAAADDKLLAKNFVIFEKQYPQILKHFAKK